MSRDIEKAPPPTSKGITGALKRLKEPDDSFLIENKGLVRASLYAIASRLGISIITRPELSGGKLRVWRNFERSPLVESETPIEQVSKPAADSVEEDFNWGA